MRRTISPRQLARALGVSESSVKRWVDAGDLQALRTSGGHRRIEADEALRFVRSSQSKLVEPELLGLMHWPQPDAGLADMQRMLVEHMLSVDAERAGAMLLQRFVDGATLAAVVDQLISPAMQRLGELWKEREDGVFLEHRATEICAQVVHRIAALLPEPGDAALALGGGPAGDPYYLPSLCAAQCLRAEGLRAINLGADLPLGALLAAIQSHRPQLVWLSVSSDEDLRAVESLVEELQGICARAGAILIVGGRSHAKLRNLERLQVARGAAMSDLTSFARGVLSGRRI